MAGLSRLCDLINASLLPFIEPNRSPLTKEAEKEMLLSLSFVSKEIQKWESEFDCESDQGLVANSLFKHCCYEHSEPSSKGDFNCLASITSVVVSFLSIDSQFVQHLAGNILVSISKFLTKFERQWIEFIHSLWISLEAVFTSIFASTPSYSVVKYTTPADDTLMHHYSLIKNEASGIEDSNFDFAKFITLLKSRLVNISWLVVAGLFRILHNILKSVKHDYEFERVFMNLSLSCLIKVPWDLFSKIQVFQSYTDRMCFGKEDFLDRRNSLTGMKDVILGTILQLLCSLVKQYDPEDAGGGPLQEIEIYYKFTKLVPQLLSCCFSKHLDHKNERLSRYLTYKVLILMNRLSFLSHWEQFDSLLWLKLLKVHFEVILYESISVDYADSVTCLEGSPFLASFANGDTCIRDLQRRAIFLLFRCCFTLIRGNKTGQECTCATEVISVTNGSQVCSEHHSHIGLSELSEWLCRCGPTKKSFGSESYSESWSSFALSFLQLYMEEDDMLFGMLLQLLDDSLVLLHMYSNTCVDSFQDVDRDVVSHFSGIFNPVHLFHLLLFSLHYDHLVLLDYLISKDSGVSCVQYLLRCLRLVCKSWLVFVEFSIRGKDPHQLCHKRRKISVDEYSGEKLGTSSMMVNGQNPTRQTFGSGHELANLHAYTNAKGCLLSLKRLVEDLQQKNLFPYNPKPLLRSFARFQELCSE